VQCEDKKLIANQKVLALQHNVAGYGMLKRENMKKFDLVDKGCYLADKHNAPYETIQAETSNKAKVEYLKLHPESKYIDILCRISRKGSFNIL
jgi:hypothetical protein